MLYMYICYYVRTSIQCVSLLQLPSCIKCMSTSLYQCCYQCCLSDIPNYRSEGILNLLILNFIVTYVILSSRVLKKNNISHDGTP